MSLLSSIWNLIKKIFSTIFSWLADIFGDWFLLLLILVIIWFAPVIAAWLVSVGAPTFVVSMFEVIAMATPYIQSAGMWLWEGGSSLVSSAWTAFRGLDAGTQASIALGAAAMIAPEETAAVLKDATDLFVDGIGAIASGLFSNPGILIAAGLAAYWLFFRKKEDTVVVQSQPQLASEA